MKSFEIADFRPRIMKDAMIIEAIRPPPLPLLKRINVGIGVSSIHCLVLEFVDGSRRGLCLCSNNEPMPLIEENMRYRGGKWVDIERGNYITCVSGYHSNRGSFLCHSIYLGMRFGSDLIFEVNLKESRGGAFHFNIDETSLVCNLIFLTNGTLASLGVFRTSLHLSLLPRHANLLPEIYEEHLTNILFLLSIIRVSNDNSLLAMPLEVRWRIVSFISGFELVNADAVIIENRSS